MSARRGLSLLETLVVFFIGIVLLFSLLPTSIGLLRHERALTASALSIETFPLLWERLGRDFSEAAVATVNPPFASPVFRIVLVPIEPGTPGVTWEFRHETIIRALVRADAEGRETRNERAWAVEGRFSLLREEIAFGRWVLRYEPPRGGEEILAFLVGRPTSPIVAKAGKKP